jgi:hypothetical protein
MKSTADFSVGERRRPIDGYVLPNIRPILNVQVGVPLAVNVRIDGGKPPFRYSVSSDPVMTISLSGRLTGTPGGNDFVVSATDAVGNTATLTVSPAGGVQPQIFFSQPSVTITEGNAGTTTSITPIAKRTSTEGALTATATFNAGTTNAADYAGGTLPANQTFNFADGSDTANGQPVVINGDNTLEPDENFSFVLVAPNGYVLGSPSTLQGTIVNDDASTQFSDPDLNLAYSFRQRVKSYEPASGDKAAALFAAFPALRTYLSVGHKSQALTSIVGSGDSRWNNSTGVLSVTTGAPNVNNLSIPGSVFVGASVTTNVSITDSLISAKQDGSEPSYKVQKDNSDTYYVSIADVTMETGQANDVAYFIMERVYQRYSAADNVKGGTGGAATAPQQIRRSWFEACGYGNPAAHGDGVQYSTVGRSRVVSCVFYSSPSDSQYSTGSYGLTNALRIDSSGSPKNVEEVHFLGNLCAFGSYYPVTVTAQQTDSITRNITVAFNIFAPAAFRLSGNAGDAVQVHPNFTDVLTLGGGYKENIGFFGNEVFGYGPVVYKDRTSPQASITGIWFWNPATLDARTKALWIDLGLLNADGTPAVGMLRSVAGTYSQQPKTVATTGAVPLNLDLSMVPDGTPITLHLPSGTNMHDLEYVA